MKSSIMSPQKLPDLGTPAFKEMNSESAGSAAKGHTEVRGLAISYSALVTHGERRQARANGDAFQLGPVAFKPVRLRTGKPACKEVTEFATLRHLKAIVEVAISGDAWGFQKPQRRNPRGRVQSKPPALVQHPILQRAPDLAESPVGSAHQGPGTEGDQSKECHERKGARV